MTNMYNVHVDNCIIDYAIFFAFFMQRDVKNELCNIMHCISTNDVHSCH